MAADRTGASRGSAEPCFPCANVFGKNSAGAGITAPHYETHDVCGIEMDDNSNNAEPGRKRRPSVVAGSPVVGGGPGETQVCSTPGRQRLRVAGPGTTGEGPTERRGRPKGVYDPREGHGRERRKPGRAGRRPQSGRWDARCARGPETWEGPDPGGKAQIVRAGKADATLCRVQKPTLFTDTK